MRWYEDKLIGWLSLTKSFNQYKQKKKDEKGENNPKMIGLNDGKISPMGEERDWGINLKIGRGGWASG